MSNKKWAAVWLALLVTAICPAQQKFPLRSGEWAATVPDPSRQHPLNLLICMNDETWTKALNRNPTCAMQQFNFTGSGGSYSLNCSSQSFQMKGTFKVTFDGMTHMISSGSIDTTFNGKTSHMDSTSDFRWKASVCNPDVDMNLKDHSRPHP